MIPHSQRLTIIEDDTVFPQSDSGLTASISKICLSAIHVSRISCGEHHVLLLGSFFNTTINRLFTFGIGNFGELGAGDLIGKSVI